MLAPKHTSVCHPHPPTRPSIHPPIHPSPHPSIQVLDSIQGGDNALVGVVTFDSSVHFYQVSAGQAQPAMMVMADTGDV